MTGGGAAVLAALLLSLLAACEATETTAADAGRPEAAAPRDGPRADSILGLPKEALRAEVEAGTGALAIVRAAPPFAAARRAAAGGDAPDAADEAAREAERPARDPAGDREMAEARRELGLALERVGDIAGAVSELEAALEAAPWPAAPEETPVGDLARICRRGEPAAAVARACSRAFASIRFGPDELAALIAHRGDANARLGRLDRALEDYNPALEIDSSHPRAVLGRARLRVRAGQPALALNDLRLAIETGPRPAEARLARAGAYEALGRFGQAVDDYEAVLADMAARPLHPAAWRGRARAHCAMGRAEAAVVDWRVWAESVEGGPGYIQEMLRARGYLRAPWRARVDPTVIAALGAWTRAGCP